MKTTIILITLLMGISYSGPAQESLSTGDKAPLFKAIADDGSTWALKDHLGKDYVVLYFYPGAMTGGCTKQACAYRDHISDLDKADAVVVGISADKPENLRLFRKAENLNFTLLSDENGEIARAFGVPLGEGGTIKRTVEGVEHELVRDISAKRWTFIIGKDGKIIYRNDAVNAEKDTEEVLNFLRKQG